MMMPTERKSPRCYCSIAAVPASSRPGARGARASFSRPQKYREEKEQREREEDEEEEEREAPSCLSPPSTTNFDGEGAPRFLLFSLFSPRLRCRRHRIEKRKTSFFLHHRSLSLRFVFCKSKPNNGPFLLLSPTPPPLLRCRAPRSPPSSWRSKDWPGPERRLQRQRSRRQQEEWPRPRKEGRRGWAATAEEGSCKKKRGRSTEERERERKNRERLFRLPPTPESSPSRPREEDRNFSLFLSLSLSLASVSFSDLQPLVPSSATRGLILPCPPERSRCHRQRRSWRPSKRRQRPSRRASTQPSGPPWPSSSGSGSCLGRWLRACRLGAR